MMPLVSHNTPRFNHSPKYGRACCSFILLWAVIAPTVAAKINLSEIRDDDGSTQSQEIVWPERDVPDPAGTASGFKSGEKFQFRGQWGLLRKAARLTISIQATETDDALLLVKTNVRTLGLAKTLFPILFEGQTLLQPQKGRILNSRVTEISRSRETDVKTTFDYEAGNMSLVDETRPDRNTTKSLPYPVPLDYASALLQVRGWNLAQDSRHSFLISSKGKFYLIEMQTMKTESIQTKFGKLDAFKLEPVLALPQSKLFREGGKMSLWVSADERRIPLRIDFKISIGTASLRIEDFTLSNDTLVAQSQ
jgi:hypothetical protein|tara:strand:- start:1450 stop:2373 length:924 start_codon:yes stop_codon:yes gene_type:complete